MAAVCMCAFNKEDNVSCPLALFIPETVLGSACSSLSCDKDIITASRENVTSPRKLRDARCYLCGCTCVCLSIVNHCTKKPVTTILTYPWKCTVLHCNHLGNTWKPLVPMTRHFDYCVSACEGDNQSVRSSAPVVSRCFPGGYNVKLYISRGRLA